MLHFAESLVFCMPRVTNLRRVAFGQRARSSLHDGMAVSMVVIASRSESDLWLHLLPQLHPLSLLLIRRPRNSAHSLLIESACVQTPSSRFPATSQTHPSPTDAGLASSHRRPSPQRPLSRGPAHCNDAASTATGGSQTLQSLHRNLASCDFCVALCLALHADAQ